MFSSPGAETLLQLTLIERTDGSHSVVIRNGEDVPTEVVVNIAILDGIPNTFEL